MKSSRLIHLDIQGCFDFSIDREYLVICGKSYSSVERADIDLFIRYLIENRCSNCQKIYQKIEY